jgi:hypothetical protein
MQYPIFSSISNFVRSELDRRNIDIVRFRSWEESVIRASGFEVEIDLRRSSDFIKKLVINWDWDLYREYALAKQLKGMTEHPLLEKKQLSKFGLEPTVDIELSWIINEQEIQDLAKRTAGNARIEVAKKWMQLINGELSSHVVVDGLINRWHVDIDGDIHGKYLSTISLISYLQYNFVDLTQLDQIQRYLGRKLQTLFLTSNRVIKAINHATELAA